MSYVFFIHITISSQKSLLQYGIRLQQLGNRVGLLPEALTFSPKETQWTIYHSMKGGG